MTGRETWTEYSSGVTKENGTTIYVCLTDGYGNYGDYSTIAMTDDDGPTVTVTRDSVAQNSITVSVSATDSVSGMPDEPTYSYYYKVSTDDDYTLAAEDVTDTTYTISGLTATTTYTIKVVTSDLVGNEGYGTVNGTTTEFTLTDGNVEFSDATWANQVATVKITNNTSYYMQYKVISKGDSISTDTSDWTETSSTTVSVTELLSGDTIYVRLYDGTNTAKGYATYVVSDSTAPTVTVSGNPTSWTSDNVTLTITAADSESGLADEAYSFDNGSTWTTDNTNTYSENTSGIIIKVRDVAGNITTCDTMDITYIDKTGPDLEVEVTSPAGATATVTADITSVSDSGARNEYNYLLYILYSNIFIRT